MTRESCYFCNEDNVDMLEEHHVVPRRFGGSDDDENLVTVCASCHNGLESLYDSRFYDELDVEKQSSKQEGLKSFDEKHPFIWAVRSYCDENSVDYSRRMYSSDVYAKDCSVGFIVNDRELLLCEPCKSIYEWGYVAGKQDGGEEETR